MMTGSSVHANGTDRPTAGGARGLAALDMLGEAAAPAGLRVDPYVWWRFATAGADAMIIGEPASVVRVLNFVWPVLRKPIVQSESRRLNLPVARDGTLVIRDAHELAGRDQQRLLEWWDESVAHPRIIATASRQLSACLEAGAFNRRVFDRLMDVDLALT